MIRTLYFEWNSVTPLMEIKAESINAYEKRRTLARSGTENAHRKNKKPATSPCAG